MTFRTTGVPCLICGGPVKRPPPSKTRTYCSNKCSGIARSRKHPRQWVTMNCKGCKQPFRVDASQFKHGYGKFCSTLCARKHYSGPNSPQFKGGYHRADGYIAVVNRGDRDLKHRVVLAETIGRPLRDDETVHHINGDKSDNRPENLMVWLRSEHCSYHATGRKHTEQTLAKMREVAKRRLHGPDGKFISG